MSTISTVLTTFPGRAPGDGICLFFFDADYEFYPAGIGGSLGYCNYDDPLVFNAEGIGLAWPLSAASIGGIRGAYLGVGLDVKGDFSTTSSNKTGYNIIKTDTDNFAVTSCAVTARNPNTVCVRTGELSSYQIDSVSPNLSTFPLSTAPYDENYYGTPSLTLHQQVTSRDDVTFHSVRVRLQNEGKHVRVEIKNPTDGKYYPYHVANLPGGLGPRLIPYTNPSTLRCGLAFSTSESVMNCEIKNFSVQGKFVEYEKAGDYVTPLTGTNMNVTLSADGGCS